MAILSSADERFELTVTIAAIDHNGVVRMRDKTFALSDGVTTYVDAGLAAAALMADLDAINEGDILKYRITSIWDDGLVSAVTAVGDVYNEALLTLYSASSPNKISHSIYSPVDAMVAGSAVVITDANLLTYLAHFETGGDFTMSDGEVLPVTNKVAKGRVRKVRSGKSY